MIFELCQRWEDTARLNQYYVPSMQNDWASEFWREQPYFFHYSIPVPYNREERSGEPRCKGEEFYSDVTMGGLYHTVVGRILSLCRQGGDSMDDRVYYFIAGATFAVTVMRISMKYLIKLIEILIERVTRKLKDAKKK